MDSTQAADSKCLYESPRQNPGISSVGGKDGDAPLGIYFNYGEVSFSRL